MLERLRGPLVELAQRHPDRTLFGFGFRSAGWSRQPTVAELDAISGAAPVVLISGDAHSGWLSSAALTLLGAPARDGAVSENEWFGLLRRLDELPGAVPGPADFIDPIAALAAKGVTGLVDFEFADGFVDWPLRLTAGVGPLRVRTAVYPHQLEQVIAAGLRTGDPLPGTGGLATMGPLKVITDGSLGTRTAWTHEPYSDGPATPDHPCGVANYSVAELVEFIRRATAAGLEVALHAIGDRANTAVLDAFAAGGGRGSVEHAQLVTRGDADRMAALGLRASVQPAHLLDDRDLTDRIWGAERAGRSFPLRMLADAGVRLALGSDAPVAELDPGWRWRAPSIAAATSGPDGTPSRRSLHGRHSRPRSTDAACGPASPATWCCWTTIRCPRAAGRGSARPATHAGAADDLRRNGDPRDTLTTPRPTWVSDRTHPLVEPVDARALRAWGVGAVFDPVCPAHRVSTSSTNGGRLTVRRHRGIPGRSPG